MCDGVTSFRPLVLLDLDLHLCVFIEGEGGWLVAGRSHLGASITTEATGLGGQTEEVAIYLAITIQILIDDDRIGTCLQLDDYSLGEGVDGYSERLDGLLEVVLSRTIDGDQEVAFLLLHPYDVEAETMRCLCPARYAREEEGGEETEIDSLHRQSKMSQAPSEEARAL